MADEMSMSQSAINRIWRAFGLLPHRITTFKLSKDPLFIEKVRDIVGLYMAPPDRTVVLCVDEKSQIQALDRTQLLLPHVRETPTSDESRFALTAFGPTIRCTIFDLNDSLYGRTVSHWVRFPSPATLHDRQHRADRSG